MENSIMLWIVIISILLLLLIYLLFATLTIYIDTGTDSYYIEYKWIVRIFAESDQDDILKLRFHTLFSDFNYYPLKTKKKKHKKKKRSSLSSKQMLRIVRSFKIREVAMDLDTGNCITNAKLYPVFAYLNYKFGKFNINFEGKNRLVLLIENRPIHIIKSFINF